MAVAPSTSVLMPVYNCEPYLDEAIRSIRGQTFADFEFVIVNDGSTDESLHTIRRHASDDPRIVVLDRANGGIVDALNAGLTVCRGEFIARMDGDDVAMPERLELQVGFLRRTPDVLAVGSSAIVIDSDGNSIDCVSNPLDSTAVEQNLLTGAYALLHPTIVVRSTPLKEIGGYNPRCKRSEDLDLLLRLSERGKLANLPQALLCYRKRNGAMSHGTRVAYAESDLAVMRDAYSRTNRLSPDAISHALNRVSWAVLSEGRWFEAVGHALNAIRMAPCKSIGWRALARCLAPKCFWRSRIFNIARQKHAQP